jgi:type I restriction enzyme S subunit
MTRGYPKSGDVLFTTEAPLGNVALLDTDELVSIGQRLIAIRPKKMLLSNYLSWALRQEIIKKDIFSRATGSTVKGIRSAELIHVKIPIPEISDQLKFENISSKVEQKKSHFQRFEKESNLLFKSLQQQAFS